MAKAAGNGEDALAKDDSPKRRPACGIVMPISEIDGCTELHWTEVREILEDVADNAGFEANLVSSADDVGIIQKRIIQNLYDNPIVVCDVSGRNPNVMFELGLRLAFDKPTIIIKDDRTSYTFDTSPIEHLEYPRDLRFSKIVEFKQNLAGKIQATHKKATTDANYTTFLKHFGEFKVADVDTKTIPAQDFIMEELREIKLMMRRNQYIDRPTAISRSDLGTIQCIVRGLEDDEIVETGNIIEKTFDARVVWRELDGNVLFSVAPRSDQSMSKDEMKSFIGQIITEQYPKAKIIRSRTFS